MGVLYTKLSPEEGLARLKENALEPPKWHENCGLSDSDSRKGGPFVRIKGSRFELGLWGNGWAPPRISGKIESDSKTESAKMSFWCYGPLACALSGAVGIVIARVLLYFLAPSDPMAHPRTLQYAALTFAITAAVSFGVGYGLCCPLWGKKTRYLLQFLRDTLEATEQPPMAEIDAE